MSFEGVRLKMIILGLIASVSVYGGEVDKSVNDGGSLDDFYRVTSCVRGGMPMEVQFVVDGNPPRLNGVELTMIEVDRFLAKIDGKVASLLRGAGLSVSNKFPGIRAGKYSGQELEANLSGAIASHASEVFGLSFCGDKDSIGDAVLADLSMYFSRSYGYGNGKYSAWFNKLKPGARNHATGILMLAVALRLAKVDYDIHTLLLSFDGD